MKTCSKCDLPKPQDQFTKRSSSKDGLHPWCKKCANGYSKNHHEKNRDSAHCRHTKWRQENQEYNKERLKKWSEENKEERVIYKREYRKNNRESINAYKRKKSKEMMKKPEYRLEINLRKRLRRTVKKIVGNPLENKSYTQASRDLLGCTINNLQEHLESKFTDKMTWGNYGKWHVDHIIPIANFDLSDEDQLQKCFHYSNLQPLWAIDNTRKGSRIT